MREDPIVAEVRRTRDRLLAEHGDRLGAWIIQQQESAKRSRKLHDSSSSNGSSNGASPGKARAKSKTQLPKRRLRANHR